MIVRCRECGRDMQNLTRGCTFWLCVVLFFPLSLLLFLVPQRFFCPSCGRVVPL